MTSHDLARDLLRFPDVPVFAYDADNEQYEEVTGFVFYPGGAQKQGRIEIDTADNS